MKFIVIVAVVVAGISALLLFLLFSSRESSEQQKVVLAVAKTRSDLAARIKKDAPLRQSLRASGECLRQALRDNTQQTKRVVPWSLIEVSAELYRSQEAAVLKDVSVLKNEEQMVSNPVLLKGLSGMQEFLLLGKNWNKPFCPKIKEWQASGYQNPRKILGDLYVQKLSEINQAGKNIREAYNLIMKKEGPDWALSFAAAPQQQALLIFFSDQNPSLLP